MATIVGRNRLRACRDVPRRFGQRTDSSWPVASLMYAVQCRCGHGPGSAGTVRQVRPCALWTGGAAGDPLARRAIGRTATAPIEVRRSDCEFQASQADARTEHPGSGSSQFWVCRRSRATWIERRRLEARPDDRSAGPSGDPDRRHRARRSRRHRRRLRVRRRLRLGREADAETSGRAGRSRATTGHDVRSSGHA